MLILTSATLPPASLTVFSRIGASCLHGAAPGRPEVDDHRRLLRRLDHVGGEALGRRVLRLRGAAGRLANEGIHTRMPPGWRGFGWARATWQACTGPCKPAPGAGDGCSAIGGSAYSPAGAARRSVSSRAGVQGVEGSPGDLLRRGPDLRQVPHHGGAARVALDHILVVGPVRRGAAVVVEDAVDHRDAVQTAEITRTPALGLGRPARVGARLGPVRAARPSSYRTHTRHHLLGRAQPRATLAPA